MINTLTRQISPESVYSVARTPCADGVKLGLRESTSSMPELFHPIDATCRRCKAKNLKIPPPLLREGAKYRRN